MSSEFARISTERFLERILMYKQGYFLVQNPEERRMFAGIIDDVQISKDTKKPSLAVLLYGISQAVGFPDSNPVAWVKAREDTLPFYVIPLNEYGITMNPEGTAFLASLSFPDTIKLYPKGSKEFDVSEVWGLEKKLPFS